MSETITVDKNVWRSLLVENASIKRELAEKDAMISYWKARYDNKLSTVVSAEVLTS